MEIRVFIEQKVSVVMKKWIKYIPIALGLIGMVLGAYHEPNEGLAYWFGAGLGLLIFASVPALIFGSIHFAIVRDKTVDSDIRNDEYLDVDVLENPAEKKKKYTWYYLFCCYLIGFGALFTLLVLIQINKGEY